ncbi:MAG: hypothetical protein RIB86_01710, partial [Imperialibacter sp.]
HCRSYHWVVGAKDVGVEREAFTQLNLLIKGVTLASTTRVTSFSQRETIILFKYFTIITYQKYHGKRIRSVSLLSTST